MCTLPVFYETNTQREVPVPVEIDVGTPIVGNPDPESCSLRSQGQGDPAPEPWLVRFLVFLAVLPQVRLFNGIQDQVHGNTCAQGMADRGNLALAQDVLPSYRDRIQPPLLRRLIHVRFQRKQDLRNAETTERAADTVVCEHGPALMACVGDAVQGRSMFERQVENGTAKRRVGTLVFVAGDVVGKHRTVALEASSHAYDERMAFPAGNQRLLTREEDLDRLARLHGKQGDATLNGQFVLASETATHWVAVDVDHPGVHPQDTGKLQLVPERILRTCIHRQRTVGFRNGHTRFGLQRHMGLTWRPVFVFDDHVRFAESLFHVAFGDEGVQADVALVVDLGGIGLQRLDGVVDDRQDFVVHVDQSRRLLGDAFSYGSQ